MQETQVNSFAQKQYKYYPSCIKQQETNSKIQIQVSIISKIFSRFCRRKTIPGLVFQEISAFVFHSPICLACPLYKKIDSCQIGLGSYLLYNQQNGSIMRMEIKKYWRKIEKQLIVYEQVMRFAVLFDDCMELKTNFIWEQGQQSAGKWKIASQNNRFYNGLFKVLNKYKKDGIINECVIKSFAQIMSRNILLVNLSSQQYLIIQSGNNQDHSLLCTSKQKMIKIRLNRENAKIGFSFERDTARIISQSYSLYSIKDSISNRGKQSFLDPQNFRQIKLNDIFIQ